jgi:molybdenum cofactor cytidylyltransferase
MALLADGQRLVDAFVTQAMRSGLPLLVCVDKDDHHLAALLAQRQIDVHFCCNAAEGMGATLAEGVAQLSNWDGVLIALADMPWVQPETYQAVAQQLQPDTICVPVYGGRRGHPVGFGCSFFPQLARLQGDNGARQLIAQHAAKLIELVVSDAAIHRDVDLPSDLISQ